MLSRRLVSLIALVCLATALSLVVACSSGDGADATREPGAPAEIDQDNLKFTPSSLTVASGEVVTFKNSETAVHTVTINGKNESGTMKKDATFLWTPPAPGTYKITCDYHPQMKATVTVSE